MYRIAIYFDAKDVEEAEEAVGKIADQAEKVWGTPDSSSSDLPWLMTLKEEELPADTAEFIQNVVKGEGIHAVVLPQPKVSDN